MGFTLVELLVLAGLVLTALAAGRPLATRLRRSGEALPAGLQLAFGLALLAQACLLLGLLGWLRLPAVLALVLAAHLAALGGWRRAVRTAAAWLRSWTMRVSHRGRRAVGDAAGSSDGGRRSHPGGKEAIEAVGTGGFFAGDPVSEEAGADTTGRAGPSVVASLIAATLFLAAVPPFAMALYPPLGFDQTMYHLPFAQAFAASGGVPFLPALRFPIFPQLAEVLSGAVLLVAGEVATQLVGWSALLACGLLTFAWGRRLSPAAGSRAGGALAATALAASPLALYLAATGYVEPVLALFGLGSLYAADRSSEDRATVGWWVAAAGLLAGSAAGVKYIGLYFLPAAALLLLLRRVPWRARLRDLGLFGLVALAALLPSYGRIVAHTGNPVFPFYPGLFGSSPWAMDALLGAHGRERLARAATLLWDAAFRREVVGRLPPLSPAFVFGLPFALLGALRAPRLRPLLVLAVLELALAPVNAHYFLAIAPLWAVVIGAGAAALVGRSAWGRRTLWAIVVMLALGGEAYAVYYIHRLGPPPITREGRERLLARQLPLYPAVAFLNRHAAGVTVYAVGGERMVAYYDGTLLGDYNGPASFDRVAARARQEGSLAAVLDEHGARYLLVPSGLDPWGEWAAADPRLVAVYRDGSGAIYRVRPADR